MRNKVILFLCIPFLFAACSNSSGDGGASAPSYSADSMGYSGGLIDVNGDSLLDLVVGAYGAGTSAKPARGEVRVYYGSGSGFPSSPSLTLEGEAERDQLGFSYANLGDVDNDGESDFAVGAINAKGAAPFTGVVYVYKGGGSSPELLAKLEGDAPMDKFGYTIAGGDLNGDGVNDVIVSAFKATGNAFQSGVVYVYFGGESISTSPDVTITGPSKTSGIGSALAAGDINGDNAADLIIGSTGHYLIYYGGSDIAARVAASQTPSVQIDWNGSGHSGFGMAVAYLGDVNGDGIGDLAVANPRRSDGSAGDTKGSIYILKGSATLPSAFDHDDAAYLLAKITGTARADRLAHTLAVTSDVNGGGANDLLAAAVWATGGDAGATKSSGKIYLFHVEDLVATPGSSFDATAAANKTYVAGTGGGILGQALSYGSSGEFFAGAPGVNDRDGGAFIFDAATGSVTTSLKSE